MLGFISVIAPLSCFCEDGNDLRQNIIGNRLPAKYPGLPILHWAIRSVSEQRPWYSWHARLSGNNTEIARIKTYIARKFSACYMTCFVFQFWLCTVPLWEAWGCHGDAREKLGDANEISRWHNWIVKIMELYQKLGTLTLEALTKKSEVILFFSFSHKIKGKHF